MANAEEQRRLVDTHSERIANGIEDLVKLQVGANKLQARGNVLLKANGRKADTTNKHKERQAAGDIKFRKQSSLVSGISLCIALLAFAISVAANGVEPLLNIIRGL